LRAPGLARRCQCFLPCPDDPPPDDPRSVDAIESPRRTADRRRRRLGRRCLPWAGGSLGSAAGYGAVAPPPCIATSKQIVTNTISGAGQVEIRGCRAPRPGANPGSASSGVIGSDRLDWLRRGAAMRSLACWIGRHEWTSRVGQGQSYTVCASCGTEPRRRRGATPPPDHFWADSPGDQSWSKRASEGDSR
jgi:hypothetical protein